MRRLGFVGILLATAALLCGCERGASLIRSHPQPTAQAVARTISILPLGNSDPTRLERLRASVAKVFQGQVMILPSRKLPKSCYYPPRDRYRADRILAWLAKTFPGERVVAVTDRDISATKGAVYDWGLFGLGNMSDGVCVASTHRLGSRTEKVDRRLARLVFHELGHAYGLAHCTTAPCLMNDAEGKIALLDGNYGFCAACRRKLGNTLR